MMRGNVFDLMLNQNQNAKLYLQYELSLEKEQIIMLYTLNLYGAVCQLYLNKTERENKLKKNWIEKCTNANSEWENCG